MARHTCLALQYAAPLLTHTPLPAATSKAHSSSAAAPAAASMSSSSAAPTDPLSPESHQAVLSGLVQLLVGPPAAAMASNWPSAAEAAVAAVYALSPQPQVLMAAVLEEMFRRCRPAAAKGA